jgi:hypothetical protein
MDNIIKAAIISFILLSANFAQSGTAAADSLRLDDSVFVMTKSPMGAMWRSAVLPGWGQIYNESYWKAPIVWAIAGYFGYIWTSSNKLFIDYRELYRKSLLQSPSGNSIYKRYREFYRDQRDLFAVYLGITYFLNLIDAYVDAHLFDFDYQFNPATGGNELRIRYNLR